MNTERLAAAIKAYRELDEANADLLDFFSAIWDIQNTIDIEFPAPTAPPDVDAAKDALATGQPLFLLTPPTIPLEAFTDVLARIIAAVIERAGMGDEANEALAAADMTAVITAEDLSTALSDVDAFTAAVAERVEASEDGALTPVTVDFVLTNALTAFLQRSAEAMTEALDGIDSRVWNSGDCPMCGTPAGVGRVLDEGELQGGRRRLSCPLCRAEWEYDRLRCARCGSRSHNDLHYIYDERDEGHRVHLCDTCHGYLKVSFERLLDHTVVPVVEDVMTLALDDLAVSKGYAPLGEDTGTSAED